MVRVRVLLLIITTFELKQVLDLLLLYFALHFHFPYQDHNRYQHYQMLISRFLEALSGLYAKHVGAVLVKKT